MVEDEFLCYVPTKWLSHDQYDISAYPTKNDGPTIRLHGTFRYMYKFFYYSREGRTKGPVFQWSTRTISPAFSICLDLSAIPPLDLKDGRRNDKNVEKVVDEHYTNLLFRVMKQVHVQIEFYQK
jgi:hypothetical protein